MTLLVMCSVTTCNGLQKPKLDYTNQYQKQLKNFVKALYVCVCAFADDFKPQQLNYDVKVTCTYIPYFESASGGGGRGGRFTLRTGFIVITLTVPNEMFFLFAYLT